MRNEHTGSPSGLTVWVYPDSSEAEAVAASLGIPVGAPLAAFDLRNDPFGRKWPDHHFEMFGVIVPLPEGRPSWPWWKYLPESPDEGFAVQIWRQRVSYGDPPIIGELRWHPETGLSDLDIRGVKFPYAPETIAPILKAIRALHRASRRTGRPPGIRRFPLAWVRAELIRTFRVVDRDAIVEPSERDVWSQMRPHPQHGPLSYRTFRARLNSREGLWPGTPWPDIRDELETIVLQGN